jgi:hypothetical protein
MPISRLDRFNCRKDGDDEDCNRRKGGPKKMFCYFPIIPHSKCLFAKKKSQNCCECTRRSISRMSDSKESESIREKKVSVLLMAHSGETLNRVILSGPNI